METRLEAAMMTEQSLALEAAPRRSLPEQDRPVAQVVSLRPSSSPETPSLLWRLILVFVGFNVAMLGFALILTALLAFIGLPVFMFGLALMQAQET
jgi:hypothetical protein